jgi:hypothetical protein
MDTLCFHQTWLLWSESVTGNTGPDAECSLASAPLVCPWTGGRTDISNTAWAYQSQDPFFHLHVHEVSKARRKLRPYVFFKWKSCKSKTIILFWLTAEFAVIEGILDIAARKINHWFLSLNCTSIDAERIHTGMYKYDNLDVRVIYVQQTGAVSVLQHFKNLSIFSSLQQQKCERRIRILLLISATAVKHDVK